MPEISEESRLSIRAQLDSLDDATKAIDLAAQPFDDARRKIREAREALLDPYGEVAGHCEGCSKLLFEGELGHRDSGHEETVTCTDCGPTYADWKSSCESIIDVPDFLEPEEVERARNGLKEIFAHIAAGGSLDDKLPAFPL